MVLITGFKFSFAKLKSTVQNFVIAASRYCIFVIKTQYMNPFFDISTDTSLSNELFPLRNLGEQRVYLTISNIGSRHSGSSSSRSQYHRKTTPGDYDNEFVYKLQKWKPVYELGRLLEHHYQHYILTNAHNHQEFLKHMRYVILPILKKQKNAEVHIELFEQWLNQKTPAQEQLKPYTVNNTIHVGNVNAPTQFQQNSDHSIQTLHNLYQKEDVKETFELIKQDIQSVNEQIRKDFAMEMDYAITQLEKDKDIKPQLLNIGSLIKQVGMGTFTNLLAAPLFELIKPHLGL
jgi:hypothetical protein